MHTADIRHNSSGYYDGTAYKAIMRAESGGRKKKGRLQSRDYKKRMDGIDTVLTAYEVNAWHIEKL